MSENEKGPLPESTPLWNDKPVIEQILKSLSLPEKTCKSDNAKLLIESLLGRVSELEKKLKSQVFENQGHCLRCDKPLAASTLNTCNCFP